MGFSGIFPFPLDPNRDLKGVLLHAENGGVGGNLDVFLRFLHLKGRIPEIPGHHRLAGKVHELVRRGIFHAQNGIRDEGKPEMGNPVGFPWGNDIARQAESVHGRSSESSIFPIVP